MLPAVTPAYAQSQGETVTDTGMTRHMFRRDYWNTTRHGQAMRANSVKSDVAGDIAFAALNDTLALAATTASGGAGGAVAGYVMGEAISELTGLLRDTDAQLPRLAKFTNTDATYLQYDDGSWCIIANGTELDHIERDSLEPMERYDLVPNAGNQVCGSPDGYYEAHGTVYRLYSSSPSNKAWYGIGFGDSYCAIPNEATWQSLAVTDFDSRDTDGHTTALRGSTYFSVADIGHATRHRTYTDVCRLDNMGARTVNFSTTRKKMRSILYNDHWESSGVGAGLYFLAKGGNALGDLLTGKAAGFLAGTDSAEKAVTKVAGKNAAKALAFYGTATTIMSQFTGDDTALPQMAKRSYNDTVYLQFDNGSWCAMTQPQMLSIMKADMIEVDVNDSLPSSVNAPGAKLCGWPDGFYKAGGDQVYYLYSGSVEDPTWYEIGFGFRYCAISSEAQWRDLLERAGANRHAPQESLHRISDTRFLEYRTAYDCPTSMVDGVAVHQPDKTASLTPTGTTSAAPAPAASSTASGPYVPTFALTARNWSEVGNGITMSDVGTGWAMGTIPDAAGNFKVYRLTSSNQWENKPEYGAGTRIGGTAANPWAVVASGDVYYWNGSSWQPRGGIQAQDVGDGWATTKSGAVARWNNATSKWDIIPNAAAVRVGGTYDNPWTVNENGRVYRWVNNVQVEVKGLFASDVGDGWALNRTEKQRPGFTIHRYNASTGQWETRSGGGLSIGGTYEDVLVLTEDVKKVYRLK
ncbi:hypothetical protein [Aquisalinus flavus]|nr:hypothetical protein [Aquisalinus flavus]MBD0426456.1 hypothetical protein [Aquisalinus flavus]UNE47990.1 hypothetical protein FF099_07980 [Aquisalinus flavus]